MPAATEHPRPALLLLGMEGPTVEEPGWLSLLRSWLLACIDPAEQEGAGSPGRRGAPQPQPGRSHHSPTSLHPQISPVKPEDAGTYVCVAQNPVGSAQVQVEVTVEAAHRTPGAPEVTVEPTLTVVAGETATLHCSATGM